MQTHITKWGNSLGVRIPRFLAQSLGLKEGTSIDIQLEDDHIVIRKKHSLELLLSQITSENLHGEIETGGEVGKEVW